MSPIQIFRGIAVAVLVLATTGAVVARQGLPQPNVDSVWSYLQAENYTDWQLFPGTSQLQEGGAPHGALLTTYVNQTAREALINGTVPLPVGSIIVKENYMPDRSFAAATVMIKRSAGYNAQANDWYWLKRNADGSVDADGTAQGCQNCHGMAGSRDYVLTEVE